MELVETFEDAYLRSGPLTTNNVLQIDAAPEPQLLPLPFRLAIQVCTWSLPNFIGGTDCPLSTVVLYVCAQKQTPLVFLESTVEFAGYHYPKTRHDLHRQPRIGRGCVKVVFGGNGRW